ncbi:hypothetical protein DRQ29_03630, partial [bacterium]
MLFNKRIIGIDPTDKSQMRFYEELSTAIVDPSVFNPEELTKELSDTTFVTVSNASFTERTTILYKKGRQTNNSDLEWSKALKQGDFTKATKVTTLVIDVDEPAEMNPEHPAYNPNYSPSAPLRSRAILTDFLANLFGWCLSADSHTSSPYSAKGRYYITSTKPTGITLWVNLIRDELYRQFGTTDITHLSGSGHSIVTAHEIVDEAIYAGGRAVYTYMRPLELTYHSEAKDVPQLANGKKTRQQKANIPTVDATSEESHTIVNTYIAQQAKKSNQTVQQYTKSEESMMLPKGTVLTHLITQKQFIATTTESFRDLPSGNYRRDIDPPREYPYYKPSRYPVLMKYKGAEQSIVTVEYTPEFITTYHLIKGQYMDWSIVSPTPIT